MQGESGLVVASRSLDRSVDDDGKIIHVINLFLEIFGDLEVTSLDLKSDRSLLVKRLKWRILPPGEFPFERAKKELAEFLGRVEENVRPSPIKDQVGYAVQA